MAEKLRILIVEDVLSDAKLVEYELKKSGLNFKSKIVEFKEDYIDALKNFLPDLVLSDYMLPRFNGKEAIKIIQEISPEIPIIIVTGSIDEQTAVECMKLGAWDYVLKDRLILLGHSIKNTLELKKDRQHILAAQEELARSEEQFRTFAESVPGVVSIYDKLPNERVKFLYQGPGLEKILGDELAQKIHNDPSLFFKMIPTEDREKLEEAAQKAVDTDHLLDTEYRLKIGEDKYIWVRSSFHVTPMKNSIYRWHGLIFEITDQKIMANELIESEKLLNKTQQMAHVGSWIFDLNNSEIYWSEEMSNILGLDDTKAEKTLSNVLKYIHPEDVKKINVEFMKSLKNNKPYGIYHRLIRPDGEIRFMHTKTENLRDKKGKVFKAIGMTQDITDFVETQKIIRKSEQLSLAIIEDSPIGVSVRDKNGTLLLYNKAWINIWGFSKKQVDEYRKTRKKLVFDKRDNYLGKHIKEIKKIYLNGGTYYIPEMKLERRFQGKNKWISQRFYALKDENGNVERVVILSEDITVRKQADLTQKVLYNIISAANLSNSLEDLFEETRNQLRLILDTTNLFIALYDEKTKMLSLPYIRDEVDSFKEFPAGKTLSAYVIKTGKPQFITNKKAEKMTAEGIVDRFGSASEIWMGVPLKTKEKIIGVIVLQSYDDPDLYTEKDLDILNFVSSEIASAIDKKRAEEEMHIQRTYFENLFQMSPDALVILSNNDEIIQTNEEFTTLFGYTNEEAVGKQINDLIVPDDLHEEGIKMTDAVAAGEMIHFESIRRDKNGNRIYVETIGKPIVLNENQLAVQAIYRNITERKLAEKRMQKDLEEKNVLLKEVHHRVKNNMQVISSMLKLQSRYIKDEKALELFKNSQNRVKSMALIHERIYKSKDLASVNFDDYVKSLTRSLFMNYDINMNNIAMEVDIQDVSVDMNAAIPLGLIINELISNALKHAFPDNRKGFIKVKFANNDSGKSVLEISDNGIGCDENLDINNPDTLGMQLVSALTSQLNGKLDLKSKDGTKFILTF